MDFLKYIIYCIVVLSAVACAKEPAGNEIEENINSKPTVPLKRRPIVPTSKLPRPRIVDVVEGVDGSIMVALSAEVSAAMITVTTLDESASECYVVDGNVFVLQDVPQDAFEVTVEVDGEVEAFRVVE
jgi:hypothetical protein